MMNRRELMLGTLAASAAASSLGGIAAAPALAALAPLKVAAVKFGSVNWLLETIKAEGLDAKQGLTIVPVELSNNQAGPISLLSGGSDVIVSDWPWALRQRGLGEALKFAPYSSALGAVMVAAASDIKTLDQLAGRRLGVAGSAIDKSWILLQTYARKKIGLDLAAKSTVQYGAAPLLTEQLRSGSLDAALNFWTQNVRLDPAGFRQILSMKEVLSALEIDPVPAFVGFIWKEATAAGKSAEIAAFLAAAQAANAILATSDPAWDRLKPLVRAGSDPEFAAVRSAYRAGIVPAWRDADMKSAEKLMQLLIESGDSELTGAGTKFDPKLFHVANA